MAEATLNLRSFGICTTDTKVMSALFIRELQQQFVSVTSLSLNDETRPYRLHWFREPRSKSQESRLLQTSSFLHTTRSHHVLSY